MSICIGTLQKMYGVLDQSVELCGNLFVVPGKCLSPEHLIFGQKGTCQNKLYSEYIFHTHPRNSLSYPSIYDAIKVVKNPEIKNSIIITEFGIWNISSDYKMPSEYNDVQKDEYKKAIKIAYDKSNLAHGENGIHIFAEQKKLDIDIINRYILRMKDHFKKFGLHIRFDTWNDVWNNGSYIV